LRFATRQFGFLIAVSSIEVGEGLRRRIRQQRFSSPQQEALLNIMVAANYVREQSERVVHAHGITLPQYNVLRILRGVHPAGHPRYEIVARMLDRAPDVTRIIDRLTEKGLVARDRGAKDRRHSVTHITREGIKLLERIDPEMRDAFAPMESRLTMRDARELSRLCESIYEGS
jgi:DNA-binding MarR family transcriptional regulator